MYVPRKSPADVLVDLDARRNPRPSISTPLVRPRNPTEIAMANIWCEVLTLRAVGVDDDIFELGGDSLSIIRIISRVWHDYQTEIQIGEVFDNPTVAGLSLIVDAANGSPSGLEG